MGYVMVGAMLEKVSGKSWEELVIEKIFVPLRLRTAGFGPQSSLGMIDAPLPHKIVDGKIKPMMAGITADNPLFIGPAGTVHMSLQDFARWASWNAGRGKKGAPAYSRRDVRQAHDAGDRPSHTRWKTGPARTWRVCARLVRGGVSLVKGYFCLA